MEHPLRIGLSTTATIDASCCRDAELAFNAMPMRLYSSFSYRRDRKRNATLLMAITNNSGTALLFMQMLILLTS